MDGTTTGRPWPSEDGSEPEDYPRPDSLMNSPQPTSGAMSGTPYQRMVSTAISDSEFVDSSDGMRRKGSGVSISYDQAMGFLGWQ